MIISTAILALVASVAAYPASTGLWPRGCTPGTLVCNGDSQFGICAMDSTAVWMDVADGTMCACSGSSCAIAASSGGSSSSSSSSSTPESSAAPEPSPTPAPSPSSGSDGVTVGLHTNAPEPAASSESTPTPSTPAATSVSSAAVVASSTPSPTPSSTPPSSSGGAYIKVFLGDGEPSAGWPDVSQWNDFDSMWSANLKNVISQSCTQFGQDNNSDQESADLKSAIESVAQSSGIDERFILAIVMQESDGCVHAPTTNYGVINPGLMQSHDGSHSCYNVSPCPSSEIVGMIQDGTLGTSSGPGLKQDIASSGASDVSQYYKAARIYNSGSIASSGLLQDGIATHCYCSDIANRLLGWSDGPSSCSIS